MKTPRPLRVSGFTLVEMLVVVGIIGVLMAILLPALTGARRAALVTKCANNLRQVGMAVSQYLSDYDQMLPGGRPSNGIAGSHVRGDLDPDEADRYEVIGDQLDRYLRHDVRIWRCPAARVVRFAASGAPVIVENGARPGGIGNDAALDLFGPAGKWRPGYLYISTRDWDTFSDCIPVEFRKQWKDDWMARNVGGLKTNQLNTLAAQAPSEIVLFFDYFSKFHSHKAVDDVYEVPQKTSQFDGARPTDINREKFQSNFLYLDGHVEAKQYGWVGGLLNVLHRPIKQKWADGDWYYAYQPGYVHQYPD